MPSGPNNTELYTFLTETEKWLLEHWTPLDGCQFSPNTAVHQIFIYKTQHKANIVAGKYQDENISIIATRSSSAGNKLLASRSCHSLPTESQSIYRDQE